MASTNVKEHEDARSLERFVDIEVSRKKDSIEILREPAEARRNTEQQQSTRI
jgi:hypothetical protein